MASLTRCMSVGCCEIRLSCRSNPPSDTMNTCRLLPNAVRAPIRRATILSWSASELLVGKAVASVTPASPEVMEASAPTARAVTRLYSFSSVWPLVCWISEVSAARTAVEP